MKIKIILINLVIIGLCIFLLEFITYKKLLAKEDYNRAYIEVNGFIRNASYLPISNFKQAIKMAENNMPKSNRIRFRILENETVKFDKNKNSILLLGCSYAASVEIEDNASFQYLLEKYSGRKVFNRAIPEYGIQHALYILKNNMELFKKQKDYIPPKYVIYTFIEDHIFRLLKPNDFFDIYLMFYKYDKNKNELVEYKDKDLLYWHSYYLRSLVFKEKISSVSYSPEGELEINNVLSDYLKQHLIAMNNAVKENFQNAQFVIFVYDGDKHIRQFQNELQKENIKVIYLSELSDINFKDKEYLLYDMNHPNGKAWKIITPLLLKRIN